LSPQQAIGFASPNSGSRPGGAQSPRWKMPDWAQAVINNARFGAVFALFPLCVKGFSWVEDQLSTSAIHEITVWLKSAGDFAAKQTLSFSLSRFHNQLFGDKQFRKKCFARTLLFSLIAFLLVFFEKFVSLFSTAHIDAKASLFDAASLTQLFLLIVLPIDFIGVGVTRKLAARASNNISFK
jgi:hypothetical protein